MYFGPRLAKFIKSRLGPSLRLLSGGGRQGIDLTDSGLGEGGDRRALTFLIPSPFVYRSTAVHPPSSFPRGDVSSATGHHVPPPSFFAAAGAARCTRCKRHYERSFAQIGVRFRVKSRDGLRRDDALPSARRSNASFLRAQLLLACPSEERKRERVGDALLTAPTPLLLTSPLMANEGTVGMTTCIGWKVLCPCGTSVFVPQHGV